jgi:hypothetical protein
MSYKSVHCLKIKAMMFNATFNNISAISWLSVLLVEETRKDHPPASTHWPNLSVILYVLYSGASEFTPVFSDVLHVINSVFWLQLQFTRKNDVWFASIWLKSHASLTPLYWYASVWEHPGHDISEMGTSDICEFIEIVGV